MYIDIWVTYIAFLFYEDFKFHQDITAEFFVHFVSSVEKFQKTTISSIQLLCKIFYANMVKAIKLSRNLNLFEMFRYLENEWKKLLVEYI